MLANQTADGFSPLPIVPFLRRVASGEEPPFVKSDPEPDLSKFEAGTIMPVVATTYKEKVEDESMNVLLALYGKIDKPQEAWPPLVGTAKLFGKVSVSYTHLTLPTKA